MGIGFDVGSYNLSVARRNKEGEIKCVKEINAFIEIPLVDKFTYQMLDTAKVPLIIKDNVAYAVGEKAMNIAYSFGNMELRRPMKDGCVNPNERSSFQILSKIIHSLIGEIEANNEVLCYSVPANAINQETDAEYHSEVLKQIFDKYEVNGKKIIAYPVNEALCLVYAELKHKFLTGFGISAGAGMVNVCYANQSVPVFQFSIVNSGDWIDKQSAKALGESATFINREKTKINLTQQPKTDIERAIHTQYRIMIRKVVNEIKTHLTKNVKKAYSEKPVDIVISGGTSSPVGFEKIFKDTLDEVGGLPIEIGEIFKPADTLYSVSRGALVAAEAAQQEGR